MIRVALRAAAYLWAGLYSVLGLALGLVALLFGATARVHAGTLEIGGGAVGAGFARLPRPFAFSAITLGHVILGTDHETLSAVRAHERVHVAQYERWGPAFIPAYLFSSLIQLVRRRDPYRDNYFEREAYEQSARSSRA